MTRQLLEEKIREHSRRYEPDCYSLCTTFLRDAASNVPYQIILNERRREEGRVGSTQSFSESIEEFRKGNSHNTTVLFEYRIEDGPLFYVALNPRPIFKGALVFIRDLAEGKTVDDEVDKKSLEAMLQFSQETGVKIWHNSSGAGATIKEAHWQGFFYQDFNISQFVKEELNGSGISTLPKYAGENFVFAGNQNIEKCLEVIEYFNHRSFEDVRPVLSEDLRPRFYEKPRHTPYSLVIVRDEIYLIPVKNEYATLSLGLGRTRIGGAELGFPGIITTESTDYNKINGGETTVNGRRMQLSPRKIHEHALYDHGIMIFELSLYRHKAA